MSSQYVRLLRSVGVGSWLSLLIALAKGFFFLSIEDETGVSRAIVEPDLFDKHRALLSHGKFLQVEGSLQNLDNDISLKAFDVMPLAMSAVEVRSHDFR